VERSQWTLIARSSIAVVYIAGFFVFLGWFAFWDGEIGEPKERILGMLLATLSAGVLTILNFFFSSSQGSADKSAKQADK
jgi:ammonia channel protein AmtB